MKLKYSLKKELNTFFLIFIKEMKPKRTLNKRIEDFFLIFY